MTNVRINARLSDWCSAGEICHPPSWCVVAANDMKGP